MAGLELNDLNVNAVLDEIRPYVEADGGYRIYRGIIKQLSWTAEPGRPDFWRWKLVFECVANEKRSISIIQDASDFQGKDGEDTGE